MTSSLHEILRIATSDARGWSHWDEVANICRATLSSTAPVVPEPDELERYKASNQRLSERYSELADALATDPMDSHESRVAKAKRLADGAGLVGLRDRLQRRCSEMGAYWRASDAHGVDLTAEQATELLRDALGVEVEIKAQPPLVVPREREAQGYEAVSQLRHLVEDIVTDCPDQQGLSRYVVAPEKWLLFSNMVSACKGLLAARAEKDQA